MVSDGASAEGFDLSHVEGRESARWVLLDFIDVVVHVMLPEERDRYRLDRLWADSGLYAYDETGASRVIRERIDQRPDEDQPDLDALRTAFDDDPSHEEE